MIATAIAKCVMAMMMELKIRGGGDRLEINIEERWLEIRQTLNPKLLGGWCEDAAVTSTNPW